MELLKEKGLDDVLVRDRRHHSGRRHPEAEGASASRAIFLPGTPMQDIVDFINANVAHAGVDACRPRQSAV